MDFPRPIIRAFANRTAYKPETAFGNVKADVLERLLPEYVRPTFCAMIEAAPFWE
jgi:hypothetical protein